MSKTTNAYKIPEKRFTIQYDGDFKKLSKFKTFVKDLLISVNPLAWQILEGTVPIKPRERGLAGGFVQRGTMTTEWEFLNGLFEKFNVDSTDEYKDILRSLGKKEKKMLMTLKSRGASFDAIAVYENLASADALARLARSPVKNEHEQDSDSDDEYTMDPTKIDLDIPWNEIYDLEPLGTYKKREAENDWTTVELIQHGVFSTLKTRELWKLRATGSIPSSAIIDAMSVINEVVIRSLTDELRDCADFQQGKGIRMHGYDIYAKLKMPSKTDIKNIFYVNQRLATCERGSKTLGEYFDELLVWSDAWEGVMNELDLNLNSSEIYAVSKLLASIEKTAEEQASKIDILNKDIATLSVSEIKTILQSHEPIEDAVDRGGKRSPGDLSPNRWSHLSESFMSTIYSSMSGANGRSKVCFACGKEGHILRSCTDATAKEAFKRAKPDLYKKFADRNLQCKYSAANCFAHQKGNCSLSHNNANRAASKEKKRNGQKGGNQGDNAKSYAAEGDNSGGNAASASSGNSQSFGWFSETVATAPAVSFSSLGDRFSDPISLYNKDALSCVPSYNRLDDFDWQDNEASASSIACPMAMVPETTTVCADDSNCLDDFDFRPAEGNSDFTTCSCYGEVLEKGVAFASETSVKSQRCIVDSGANDHITGEKGYLRNIRAANRSITTTNGVAKTSLMGDLSDTVTNVLCMEGLPVTLLSVYKLCADATKPTAVVMTTKGAWFFNPESFTDEQKSSMKQLAKINNGVYDLVDDLRDSLFDGKIGETQSTPSSPNSLKAEVLLYTSRLQYLSILFI